ncbi:MAG TPA: murein biosynthesis integral membrane protein MurJ [Chloroflexota bacterium]|nr:murein biosynthesis integral membrane protein MurJ [Chloroflexota bacterium]
MTARTAPGSRMTPRAGRLASAALLLSASLILSRVLGVVRTAVIADVFGNGRPINAYFAAFRIPDTMFTLVSGGALAAAFVPVFAGLLGTGTARDERAAWRVASTVFNSVAIALAAMAVVSFVLAPEIMGFLAGGSGFTASQRALSVDLTRIMLLQPIFLGASAVVTAVLQSYRRFVLTAIAPLLYNVSVIIGALLGRSHGVVGLSWFVVIGAAAQFAVQIPGLGRELRNRYRLEIDRNLPEAREVLHLFIPRMIGLAAFQGMLFVTLYLATRLPPWALGAFNYSWLLIAFPVAALGTASATAIFPTLSQLSAHDEVEAIRRTVNRSLRFVLFLAVPAAVGLLVLRRPIIDLLYNHGAWGYLDTEHAAFALLFLALAIPPLASIEILPRVFYAMRDTVTPVRIAIVAVVLDAGFSILLVHLVPRDSGQGGLALATAIATLVQAVWLVVALDSRLGGIGRASLAGTLRDTVIASAVMGLALYVMLDPFTAVLPQRGIGALVTVVFEVGVGLATFGASAYLLGAPELWEVWDLVARRK